ncbi:K+/H+ antiporter subunit F [Paracoccus sulfuroxidans]|uniref:Multisubunit potassium/proton antiporter, PhaF subunit (TC 2.A.63.1.1) n=1 Tax=Paracoccus sulfuroxidans TaxID=384678 RepID=A0A562NQD0_9RHOB|nr:K+/H+ antiporter subunit F [Paracoccus sulfuroxidans]TWI34398.1 multisubunit potassium/proton antiporter, PhaF subunit (TC 2.A.63.1.1) [Paracoccus sulfuroxidans]
MIAYALWLAFAAYGVSLLFCLYRIVVGPTIPDRALALDTMTVNVIALLTLFGIQHGTTMFFEASMLFAMLGFVSTVAFAKFVLRGDIIE